MNMTLHLQVESVGDDSDKSRYLQSPKSSRSTESGHLNPETRARLRALLESTGLPWSCVTCCCSVDEGRFCINS